MGPGTGRSPKSSIRLCSNRGLLFPFLGQNARQKQLAGAGFTLAYSSENTVLHVEGIVAGEVAGSVSGVDGSHLKALGWDRSQLVAFKPHPCPLLLCISFHKYPRECHQLGTKCSRRDTAPPPPATLPPLTGLWAC